MIDDFTTEALSYLCDELDPGRRAEFEKVLERDPVAAAGFKACADSVALYAMAEAQGAALEPGERAAILAAVNRAAGAGLRPAVPAWRRHFWAVAAAALLALNLGQWAFHNGKAATVWRRWLKAEAGSASGPAGFGSEAGTKEQTGAPSVSPRDTDRTVSRELARLATLRRDYAQLQHSRDALNSEYRQILQQLATEAVSEQGSGRIVAMELVDGASYASGSRTGLMDLGSTVLAKPGIAAAGPPIVTNPQPSQPAKAPASTASAPTTPAAPAPANVASSPPNSGFSATANPSEGAAVASLEGSTPITVTVTGTSVVTTGITGTSSPSNPPASTGTSNPAPSSSPAAPTSDTASAESSTTPAAATPYAVSLYDQVQNQGYLDLYNLPQVSDGQSLQLWVEPAGSSNFQNVGEIPSQYYGESGGVYYKLPDGTASPAQIMITVEPAGTAPAAPTGTVVLRGP